MELTPACRAQKLSPKLIVATQGSVKDRAVLLQVLWQAVECARMHPHDLEGESMVLGLRKAHELEQLFALIGGEMDAPLKARPDEDDHVRFIDMSAIPILSEHVNVRFINLSAVQIPASECDVEYTAPDILDENTKLSIAILVVALDLHDIPDVWLQKRWAPAARRPANAPRWPTNFAQRL